MNQAGHAGEEGESKPSVKKLIEFGWDEPDTAFLRQHIARMEQTPFDGCVFHTNALNKDGKNAAGFMWECWGSKTFRESDLAASLEDLKATPFKRFKHSFLRFNTAPGEVEWFDDPGFAAVLTNARLAAKVAK